MRIRAFNTTAGIAGTLGAHEGWDCIDEWVALARSIDDPYELAQALSMLATKRHYTGLDGAVEAGEESLRNARRSGSPTSIAYALFVFALALDVADSERALRLIDESVAAARSVRNEYGVWVANQIRANLLSRIGDHAGALRTYVASADGARHSGNRSYQVICLWATAGELALGGGTDAPAIIEGWTSSLLGGRHGFGLGWGEYEEAIARVKEALGDDRYRELAARGAAMDDDEITRFAEAAVEEHLDGERSRHHRGGRTR